jgi:glycosyltransferase involved in cell wall biosynthesis
MKILLIAPLPDQGGPKGGMGSVTENMIHFFENNKDIVQLSYYNTLHKIRPITSSSLLVRILTGISNSLKTYYGTLFILKKNKPDLIHLASSASFALIKDYLIVEAARRRNIPIVMHWHFGRVPDLAVAKNWEWSLFKYVIRHCTLSIVIDPKTLETLQKEGISNILYIPNSMAPDVENKAKGLKHNKNQHRNKNKLIYVGHVIKDKGVFELVEACSKIPAIDELMLVGSYSEEIKKELAVIAAKKNEGTWLKFTGQQSKEQVLEIMSNSSVLALPSYTEGFPMVIVEAMAMGCAIIATNVGAIPEMLAITSDKPCGICIPPQNVDKLEAAILSLFGNAENINILGQRGVERVLKTYNFEKVNGEYLKAWGMAVNESSIISN